MVREPWLTLGKPSQVVRRLDFVEQVNYEQERLFKLGVVGLEVILGAVLDSIPAQSLPGPEEADVKGLP